MQFDKTLTERDFPVHYKIHASVDEQSQELSQVFFTIQCLDQHYQK